MGQWVLDHNVDGTFALIIIPLTLNHSYLNYHPGLDIDYEDLSAFNAGNGNAENWLISFTQTVRTKLPQGKYIVTHAPVAPWFAPNKWGGGGLFPVPCTYLSIPDFWL